MGSDALEIVPLGSDRNCDVHRALVSEHRIDSRVSFAPFGN
jgi:hypothetical protein